MTAPGVPFDDLPTSDLIVDAIYRGGAFNHAADDPIAKLLPVGNQGGFRRRGSVANPQLVVLYTSGSNPDWPDVLDEQSGRFTYFGDNRSPGQQLHDTPKRGNLILRAAFEALHSGQEARSQVPPFLLFAKEGQVGRDVIFRGLLAPGGPNLSADDDLQAIWRTTSGKRFQNYRAHFTVLDTAVVSRAWINDILAGQTHSPVCPPVWTAWVNGPAYTPLLAQSTTVIRTKTDQLPADAVGTQMLATIYQHFATRPTDFEACAVEIWRMLAPATSTTTVTRPSVDYGRDAFGVYHLGPKADPVPLDFVLEAKCYAPANSVGVRETSRLISRIRHRMFGVLVTTSYLHSQAYVEIREDQHPIVVICGRDIIDALKSKGYNDPAAVQQWLNAGYPPPA